MKSVETLWKIPCFSEAVLAPSVFPSISEGYINPAAMIANGQRQLLATSWQPFGSGLASDWLLTGNIWQQCGQQLAAEWLLLGNEWQQCLSQGRSSRGRSAGTISMEVFGRCAIPARAGARQPLWRQIHNEKERK